MMYRLIKLWWIRCKTNFSTFFKRRKINKINQSLEKAVKDQEVDRIVLQTQIMVFIRKKLNLKANSKFIPKKIKNKTEIHELVYGTYGDQMKALNLTLTTDLMFK